MNLCASGGIILSSVVTRYQLGFDFQAGLLIFPPRAFTPHGTCESAMNAAFSTSTSPAKEAGNFALSRNRKPSCGGSIGGYPGARCGVYTTQRSAPPSLVGQR